MALVIETGAVVAEADSYATLVELAAFATQYGKAIPSSATDKEALLRRAALEMDALQWKGERVSASQTLSWPRAGVCRNGFGEASDSIPANIKKGQMALALEIYEDDLNPADTRKGAVKRQKVEGAVEVEYAELAPERARRAAGRQSAAFFTGFIRGGGAVALVRG